MSRGRPGRAGGGKLAPGFARGKGLDAPVAVISALWNHRFVMAQPAERQQVAGPRLGSEEMADITAFLPSLAPIR